MKLHIILKFLLVVLILFPLKGKTAELEIQEISVLSVNSAITPATLDYLTQHFETLPKTSLIVLKLNTPGGLVSTTKEIITMVSNHKRPLAVWVTPEGASASSAGAIIASAAHFIFMSPGTNMGAATPVGLGEDLKESDGRKKALNDLTALIRSLSDLRSRPAKPFEEMITNATSYSDKEAKKLGIIDGIISHEKDILPVIESKKITLDGSEVWIKLNQVSFKSYEPTIGQQILEVLANPSTAYFLFLIGVALIYFEFQAPGGYIAGSIGICLLILAGIAFQVLPLDWGSMGLIFVGLFLLVLELFVVSYGLLSLAGLGSFVVGSLFLFHDETGFISVKYSVLLSAIAGTVITLGAIAWYLWREKKKQVVVKDFFLPVGSRGLVLTKLGTKEFQVKVKGEIWRAFSDEELSLQDSIIVTSVDSNKLLLKIKKETS